MIIKGKIKMPFTCCTVNEPIYEEATGHYTDYWSIISGARIELKDAQTCESIDTTVSDETGYYEFDDVEPGLYIITAECPVKQNYLLKEMEMQ